MFTWDYDIIPRRKERNGKQRTGECNVCKKKFSSRNKLFQHLRSTNPTHMTESHYISYEISCKAHPEYIEKNWLNVPSGHFIPYPGLDEQSWFSCEHIYVMKIKITPYYREEKAYYVTDFDPEVFKRPKPVYKTILERHRAQYD